MQSTETPDHHGSHCNLLWIADDAGKRREIDAIIVPTARHPACLAEAATLAESLSCILVTLHSPKWTSSAKAVQQPPPAVDLIAMDMPDLARLRMPSWETSRMLPGTVRARRTDVSAKRNMGLALSRMLNWSRILFLDDDISGLNSDDVRWASGLLDAYNVAGLHVGGFPDHSVVCRFYRQAGGAQRSFIGGGALVGNMEYIDSFFPDIYNEDWFFVLGDKGLHPIAVTGGVRQHPYDPFRNPDQARAEELGDALTKGIYWLLDEDRQISDGDQPYWTMFLLKRRCFIMRVLRMVGRDSTMKPGEKARKIGAVKASLGRLALITPILCKNYLQAWMADRQWWHRYLEKLETEARNAGA